MKNKWENYSLKDGKVSNSYLREYSPLSPNKQLKKEENGKSNARSEDGAQLEDSQRRILANSSLPKEQTNILGQEGNSEPTNKKTEEKEFRNTRGKEMKKVVIAKGKEESAKQVRKAHDKPGGSNVGKYKKVSPSEFAGTAGGAPKGSYPINTPKRAKAALAYAHNAPDPKGIKEKVYSKYPNLKK